MVHATVNAQSAPASYQVGACQAPSLHHVAELSQERWAARSHLAKAGQYEGQTGVMSPFERAVLIFNPNSTGDAPRLAKQLRDDLADQLPELPVVMCPTQHEGHGRELAEAAAADGRPLVVSVSGDGGYNEVVDGLMRAGNDSAVAAVLAAGNANDHRRATADHNLVDAIVAGQVHRIDLLRLSVGEGAGGDVQYAHSYIGLGLTPLVAIDLERGEKVLLPRSCRQYARSRSFGRSRSTWKAVAEPGSTVSYSPTSTKWLNTPR